MTRTYYITGESFGSNCPANWEEIASALNDVIDARGIADDPDEVEALWDEWCNYGIEGVPAPRDIEYTVFIVGGDRDGETILKTDDLGDAIDAASLFSDEHYDDSAPFCVCAAIVDNDGNDIEW